MVPDFEAMIPERWRRVEELYHAALSRRESDRAAFLAGACAGDDALHREVESLLTQPASAEGFLDGPAVAVAANMVSDVGTSEPRSGRLGAYQLRERIGVGGMGEVYRARDTKLGRDVAVKFLRSRFTSDPERLARFEREARLLASLNHPHIGAIYGLEDGEGGRALVLELVEGETLADRLARGRLPLPDALAVARQIADALHWAHERGIIHRDLKPANIKITPTGVVKILDFGLGKIADPPPGAEGAHPAVPTVTIQRTREGLVLGTPAYMSPEQAQGKTVDDRSDVFAFGIVLYEMLAGRSPFTGTTTVETIARILEGQPTDLRVLRKDLPAALAWLVDACLEKDRQRRPSANEVRQRLAAIEQSQTIASAGLGAVLRRRAVVIPAVIVALAGIASAGAWWASGRDARAARARVPELLQLADRYDYDGFYRAARSVIPLLPDDLQIKQVWLNLTFPSTIASDPPGADVSVKGYLATNAEWIHIGRTPIEQARVPGGAVRVRVSKEGYAPVEGTLRGITVNYTLDPVASVPAGMVRVPANVSTVQGTTLSIPAHGIDRFEVTNRQFKAFVNAGGYRTQEYWKEPIRETGRTLTWHEAMARFRDRTGRSGPSTWEVGTYLEGQADFPVSGVSWYEAAAYAAFAGKSLPTAFQWRGAASGIGGFGGIFSDILTGNRDARLETGESVAAEGITGGRPDASEAMTRPIAHGD